MRGLGIQDFLSSLGATWAYILLKSYPTLLLVFPAYAQDTINWNPHSQKTGREDVSLSHCMNQLSRLQSALRGLGSRIPSHAGPELKTLNPKTVEENS